MLMKFVITELWFVITNKRCCFHFKQESEILYQRNVTKLNNLQQVFSNLIVMKVAFNFCLIFRAEIC